MQIKELHELLPYLFEAQVTPLLIGSHGIGKSQAVAQFAKEHGYLFVDVRLGALADSGDLTGLPEFVKDKLGNSIATKFMQPDWLPKDGQKCLVFLDEVNRAKRDLLQAIFQLVLDRRIGQYNLPAESVIVAAMNPPTGDYTVTDVSDAAFMDRFCHIKLTPSKKEFLTYMENKGATSSLVQFLRERTEMVDAKTEDFSLDVQPSRRSWDALARIEKQNPPQNLFEEAGRGLVGAPAITAYLQHLAAEEKSIAGEEVLNNLKKHVETLQKWADPTKNRADLINATSDNLVKEIDRLYKAEADSEDKPKEKESSKALTAAQLKNVAAYVNHIPMDSARGFITKIISKQEVGAAIEKNKEFMEKLALAHKKYKEEEATATKTDAPVEKV